MKTVVYFVRHAKADYSNHDDHSRSLTDEGIKDTKRITDALRPKNISVICSSPYRRAIDTICEFAELSNIEIMTVENFRERKVEDEWIEDFDSFARQQWADFSYKRKNGESLSEVQARNVVALFEIIKGNRGQNIVVGTHGTALSTILNYFDSSFGYEDFCQMTMPDLYKLVFENDTILEIEKIVF